MVRVPDAGVRSRAARRPTAWLMTAPAALVCATSVLAQGPPGKKPDEGAWVALLLLPVMVLVSATLQLAVLSAFPRFARRCAAAVSRYRWQTPLAGLAALLATGLLAAIVNKLAGGNEQAGVPVVAACALLATAGGVGVSLLAGRWALRRIAADAPTHPLLEILAGASLLGWAMILIPCVGQVLGALAACAALGAPVMALVLRHRLDEVPRRSLAPPPAEPLAPPQRPDRPAGGQMF